MLCAGLAQETTEAAVLRPGVGLRKAVAEQEVQGGQQLRRGLPALQVVTDPHPSAGWVQTWKALDSL